MKKLLFNIIFLGLILGLKSQTSNHIHHLYGFSEPTTGLFRIQALNQQSSTVVEIETFTSNFTLGGPHAQRKSDNYVFFMDSSSGTVTIQNNYFLPELYTTPYSGQLNTTTQGANVSALCVNPNKDSIFYSYSFLLQNISEVYLLGGIVNQSNPVPMNDLASLGMVYYQGLIYVYGQNSVDSCVIKSVFEANLQVADSSEYVYKSLKLVSDPVLGIYGVAQDLSFQNILVQLNPANMQLIELGNLPSCVNCGNETFSFETNGLALDFENNNLIAIRSEEVNGNLNYFLSTYSLTDASEVYNTPLNERISNLVFVEVKNDLVYPGDANQDQVVNMEDLLPIGLKYNDQVPLRAEISMDWIGQDAFNTNDTLNYNGLNADKKHADCNGDGQVNAIDINAIYANYSYKHNSFKSTQEACLFPLYMNLPEQAKEDAETRIEIGLNLDADALQNVYGLTFTLEYDTAFVVANSMTSEGRDLWFGVENSNYVQINVDNYKAGRIDIGVTGIDKLNRSGGGVLLDGVWTMEGEVIPIAQGSGQMHVKISNVLVIDFQENELDACGVDTFLTVYDKTVAIKNREEKTLILYPNPTLESHFSITDLPSLERVDLFDVQGKFLTSYFDHFEHMSISSFNKGIYLVKAYTQRETYFTKLVANY